MNDDRNSPFRVEFAQEITVIEKCAEVIALISLAMTIYFVASNWTSIPDKVPVHFGVSGEPDGWGDKAVLFIVTFVQAVVYLLLTYFSRKPAFYNLPLWLNQTSRDQMKVHVRQMLIFLKAEIMAMLTFIIWTTIQVALGEGKSLSVKYMILFVAMILSTAIWYFVRLVRAK